MTSYGKARYDGAGIQADLITSALEPTHWKVRWQNILSSSDGKIDLKLPFNERLYPNRGTAKGQYTRIKGLVRSYKGREPAYVVELIPCTLIEHEPIKDV